ncbi:hypothetical protein D020_1127A, partial [Vibrio parahaemolyticus SBR10290]
MESHKAVVFVVEVVRP